MIKRKRKRPLYSYSSVWIITQNNYNGNDIIPTIVHVFGNRRAAYNFKDKNPTLYNAEKYRVRKR